MDAALKGRPMTPAAWDRSYRMGLWDFLHESREAARYGVVSAFVRSFGRGGRVLDLGCGEAVLYHYVEEFSAGYVGVDISARAIDSARVDAGRARLLVADIAATPLTDFANHSVVVLNEVLYHVEEPMAFLAAIRAAMPEDGVVILSMFQPAVSDTRIRPIVHGIWAAIEASGWPLLASVTLTDKAGAGWDISVIPAR